MKTFDRIKKDCWVSGNPFYADLTMRIVGISPVKIATVLTNFAPYLVLFSSVFFIETEEELMGKCTAISDDGMRFDFEDDSYEWISIEEISKFKLKKQENYL